MKLDLLSAIVPYIVHDKRFLRCTTIPVLAVIAPLFGKTAQRLIFTLLFCHAVNVSADNTWSYLQKSDPLSNRTYSLAQSPLPTRGRYDNLRMEIVCKDNVLQITIDADSLIASQGSDFDFEYQIDKNPAVTIQMKTFPDSKRKGYTEQYAKRIVNDILAGQSIFIRVNTMIRKVLSAALPLENAAEAVKHVVNDCGLNLSADVAKEQAYSLAEFERQFGKLSPARQQQVLDQLKQIMNSIEK